MTPRTGWRRRRWEGEIVAAVLTGVSNARSEALNRIAKLEARQVYSFRNPRKPAPPGPHRLHPRPRQGTCPDQEQIRTTTRSRLTSMSRHRVPVPALLVVSYPARERSPDC
jgi:hypothetical protein